jgi:phage repressor protein C with HTH and peptisase S24 domain
MDETGARATLERLIEEQGADYAGVSRLIGRNPAYIQQYIKRGTPRRLAEEDRRTIASFFGVAEDVLGGPSAAAPEAGLARVPRLDVGASAGGGAFAGAERERGHIAFDPAWLRRIARDSRTLSLIAVNGDSMAPTLADGDEIMVDRADDAARLRDGIYVLRIDDALVVKRVALSPTGRTISIRSDNPAYPSWPDCDPADLAIVGRVVWFGRKL